MVNPAIIIGLGAFVFVVVTLFIILPQRNRRAKRQRSLQAYQQSILPTHHHTGRNALQKAEDRRTKQLLRSSGPLGWNAQRFPDRLSAPLPATPTPAAPPRAHVRRTSNEADPPPPYVA